MVLSGPAAGVGAVVRAGDLLHLLEAYEGVVAARPIEAGNREFLLTLLASARRLAAALEAAPEGGASPELAGLVRRVREQTPANARETAPAILHEAAQRKRAADARAGGRRRVYLRGTLPPLGEAYASIAVVFGPGLGLGDQIAFLQFLRAVRGRYPDAPLTLFTLYPNLWPSLLPGVREVHYRGAPLRPFAHLRRRGGSQGRELVLVLDFEVFHLHRRVIPREERRDVLEVALGRRSAWLARGGSPWVRTEHFPGEADNYALLAAMAGRAVPGFSGRAWEPVREPAARPRGPGRTLLLNPLTSKRLHLAAADWAAVVRGLHGRLSGGAPLRALVYPGVHAEGRAHAQEVCGLIRGATPGVDARLLGEEGPGVTPLGALPILVRALEGVDLCLTIDTFTAHLVPLFGVPTVTVTDRDNRDFWVPAPWSIHHVVERPDARHLDFVARILAALAEPAAAGIPADGAVPALLSATRRAADEGLHAETIAAVHDALASVLRSAGPDLLYRRQGQEWLLAWSYLASAVRREPTDAGSLAPYLHHWRQSPFLKLAGLCAAARSASSSSATA